MCERDKVWSVHTIGGAAKKAPSAGDRQLNRCESRQGVDLIEDGDGGWRRETRQAQREKVVGSARAGSVGSG